MVRIVLLAAGLLCGFGSAIAAQDELATEESQETSMTPVVQPEAEDKQFDFEEFLKDLKKLEDSKESGD